MARLEACGVDVRPVDFGPLLETAALLYDGPWTAERYLVVQDLIERAADALLPVTRSIIERGRQVTGTETFAGLYRLRALQR